MHYMSITCEYKKTQTETGVRCSNGVEAHKEHYLSPYLNFHSPCRMKSIVFFVFTENLSLNPSWIHIFLVETKSNGPLDIWKVGYFQLKMLLNLQLFYCTLAPVVVDYCNKNSTTINIWPVPKNTCFPILLHNNITQKKKFTFFFWIVYSYITRF